MKPSTLRKITVAAVFALVAISLATHAASGTLSAIGYDSIALICPLGALEVLLGAKEFLLHPIVLLLAVAALTLVFGKAFCAWLCPTPAVQALFRPKAGKAKKRASAEKGEDPAVAGDDGAHGEQAHGEQTPGGRAPKPATTAPLSESELRALSGFAGACSHECRSCAALKPLGGARDGFRLDMRFAVLGGTLLSAAVFGFPVFCLVCPIGLVFATFIGLWHLFQFNETSWGLLLFPAILVLELAVFRKWCHRLCPLSALLSLISTGNRTFRPRVDSGACLRTGGVDCHACVDSCPERLDPHAESLPECTKCGRCLEACPAGAISFPALPKRAAKPAAESNESKE